MKSALYVVLVALYVSASAAAAKDQTKGEVEIHTDPITFLLATGLVNLLQKSWTLKTLKEVISQVAKPLIKVRMLTAMTH